MSAAPAPMLCVPGTLCDAALFAPMLSHLPREGRATAPITHGDVAEAAQALLADAPPRFVALGFSLGSFVVLEWLRSVRERIAGVVLIGGNARSDPPESAAVRREQLALVQAEGTGALIDRAWPRYVAPANRDRADLRAVVTQMAERTAPAAFAAQTELGITRPDRRALVCAEPGPMLLLRGAEDALCPPDRYDELAGPGRRRVEIAGAGHFAPLEAPQPVAEAIDRWLSEETI